MYAAPSSKPDGSGSETRSSMAVVVIGGLITSTVFTLVIIPILFLFIENHRPGRKGADSEKRRVTG